MKCHSLEVRWKESMINVVAKTMVLVVLINDTNYDQVIMVSCKNLNEDIQSYLVQLKVDQFFYIFIKL